MSKRTGLILTLTAFGLFADAQLALAQQNLAINNLGNGRAESGLVTYNRFFKEDASSQNHSAQNHPAQTNSVQTNSVQTRPETGQRSLDSVLSNTQFASARQESAGTLELQPATQTYQQQATNSGSTQSLSWSNQNSSGRTESRFTPQVPQASTLAPSQNGGTNAGQMPLVTPVPAGQQAACDSAVTGYGSTSNVGCDSSLSSGNAIDAKYQRSYTNRRPTDYDAQRSFGATRNAGPSIYEQVTNQFNDEQFDVSQIDFSDCDAATTRPTYFGSYTALLGLPYYSDTHSGAVVTEGGLTRIEPFDYDTVYASRVAAGFETSKGPGGLIEYFNMSANSNLMSIGEPTVATMVNGALNVPFSTPLTVSTPTGGRLEASAQQDLSSLRVEAFKRIYWPISTLSGGLGLNYTTFDQRVNYANFLTPTATTANMTLDGQRRFEGIGPTFSMQYHRPIGHTHLAAVGGIQAGVLFGSDDWEVLSDGARIYETHGNRVVSMLNVNVGVEYSKALSECGNSRLFVRTTIEGQNWLNMGSFASTNSDFGFLSGNFSVGVAY